MTRLDRILKLLEDYDDLAAIALSGGLYGLRYGKEILPYLRKEKEQLIKGLIEHGYRRKN